MPVRQLDHECPIMNESQNALTARAPSRLSVAVAAGLIAVAASASALAQPQLWAIDENVCTTDGTKCIKGIVKSGAPFPNQAACEKQAQALLRQYQTAHMRITYMRCVPVG